MVLEIPYLGSLQKGSRIICESPIDEVWSRVAQFGHSEFLSRQTRDPNSPEWIKIADYATVRFRQAVEFRKAAKDLSLLTSPLPYYYSFLNLTRACVALLTLKIPEKGGHGLKYESGGQNILGSTAELKASGTFFDYLQMYPNPTAAGAKWDLDHCFARIIETIPDYEYLSQRITPVVPVNVTGHLSGEIIIQFKLKENEIADFRNHWQETYPQLSGVCTLLPDGSNLRASVTDTNQAEGRLERPSPSTFAKLKEKSDRDRSKIIEFCQTHLEPHLIWDENNRFYIYQNVDRTLLPRAAYYFLGVYILGNTVRYEPQLLIELAKPDSAWGWFLGRFLKSADRFFPQLMLSMLSHTNLFFS